MLIWRHLGPRKLSARNVQLPAVALRQEAGSGCVLQSTSGLLLSLLYGDLKEQTVDLVRSAQSWLPASQIFLRVTLLRSPPARSGMRHSVISSLLIRYWRGQGDLTCTWTSAVQLPRGSYLDPELKTCRLLLSGPLSLPVRSEIFSCSGGSNQAQTSLSYVLALPSAA